MVTNWRLPLLLWARLATLERLASVQTMNLGEAELAFEPLLLRDEGGLLGLVSRVQVAGHRKAVFVHHEPHAHDWLGRCSLEGPYLLKSSSSVISK